MMRKAYTIKRLNTNMALGGVFATIVGIDMDLDQELIEEDHVGCMNDEDAEEVMPTAEEMTKIIKLNEPHDKYIQNRKAFAAKNKALKPRQSPPLPPLKSAVRPNRLKPPMRDPFRKLPSTEVQENFFIMQEAKRYRPSELELKPSYGAVNKLQIVHG
jgi:hypothetical protein